MCSPYQSGFLNPAETSNGTPKNSSFSPQYRDCSRIPLLSTFRNCILDFFSSPYGPRLFLGWSWNVSDVSRACGTLSVLLRASTWRRSLVVVLCVFNLLGIPMLCHTDVHCAVCQSRQHLMHVGVRLNVVVAEVLTKLWGKSRRSRRCQGANCIHRNNLPPS